MQISKINATVWAACAAAWLSSLPGRPAAAQQAQGEPAHQMFRAGAVAVDISPTTSGPIDPPSIIAGGFLEARASTLIDHLFARSIALDDGSTTISLTIVDTCMMRQDLIDKAKLLASAKCGILPEKMMVSATHTHSAPAAMACLGTRVDERYAALLPIKIADAIVAAHAALQPAQIGWSSVDDWEHTHNRRWIRKPEAMIVDPFGLATGRAHMHPGYLSADIVGPSGPVDPALSVISIRTASGKPLAVLANYSQHYFGSKPVSADYYGHFCNSVAKILNEPGHGNGPFICAMSQGTSGDLMWMDYGSPAKSLDAATYAAAVAGYASKALDQVQYHSFARLAMVEKTLPLKYRVPDEARLAWARPIASGIQNGVAKSVPEVYANEALILHERQATHLKLQAICIGDLTIATLPNEVYALTGLKLKGRSPSAAHVNIELANGAEGYIPPPEQHTLGGYTTWPARTAGLEVNAEPAIVAKLVEALEEATGKSRRTMTSVDGPYAEGILKAEPQAYWRLNDEDGALARNSVPNGPPARLSGGFAWYLSGPGSGSGIGAQEHLTPSPFSGPTQINRAVHLASGELTADIADLKSDFAVTVWFWLGEKSGASQREGTLCRLPSGAALIARQTPDHRVHLALRSVLAPAVEPSATAEIGQADDWHFVTLVQRAGTLQVTVDGSAEPLLRAAYSTSNEPGSCAFGSGLQGKLDEIAVFNRALSASEIQKFWRSSGVAEQHRRAEAERTR